MSKPISADYKVIVTVDQIYFYLASVTYKLQYQEEAAIFWPNLEETCNYYV